MVVSAKSAVPKCPGAASRIEGCQNRLLESVEDRALAVRRAQMAGEKFGFNQSPEVHEGEEMLIFKHTVAFAWKLLYEDATR